MSDQEKHLVSVKEQDFLEEDTPIRGQNYCCLSFISPENVIDNKNVYFFGEYICDFSKKMIELFDNLKQKYGEEGSHLDSLKDHYEYIFDKSLLQNEYKYFVEHNSDLLEDKFSKENNFQTSVRGVKIRGVYDTYKEAQIRSEVLKRKDNMHNIFIGQVGCWLPFDPNPNSIENQEYSETQLNTLMKSYKENEIRKSEQFDDRKENMMNRKQPTKDQQIENEIINQEDPWVEQKINNDD